MFIEGIKQIRDFYRGIKDLEQKMFWVILPVVLACAFVSFVATIAERIGYIPIIGTSFCLIVPIVIAYFAKKTERYDICYFLLSILMCGIFVPYAYCISGGILSGMPIFCAGSTVLCGLCFNKKYRIFSIFISIGLTSLFMLLSIKFPQLIIAMPDNLILTDIYVSYLIVAASLAIISSVVTNEFHQNTKTSSILERHMDSGISSVLLSQNSGIINQGIRSNTVVMFADICSFTSISESMAPEIIAEYLNTFFEIADECIHNHGGILDKYIGDCVMAYWQDEGDNESVYQACLAALDMRRRIDASCEDIYARFKCELDFSCGINYGEAVVGEVGSTKRKDFTVIGDTVNMASRLQSIAPAGGMYISSSVAEIINERLNIVRVPKKVVLKGKSDPVDIYTLVGKNVEKAPETVLPAKKSSGYVLHICGSRGSYSLSGKRYAEFGGETSCYLLLKGDYALLIDCGTGLQRARELLKDCKKVDVIITHLHYDHIIGILDWSLFPQEAEITFYGGFDKWLGDKSLSKLFDAPYWPINPFKGEMVYVSEGKPYNLGEDIKATFFPADHPNYANIVALEIQDKRICVMADCENPEALPSELIHNCDILIYDGMYEDKYYHEHIGWGHSTWESGLRLAQKENVGRLIISHHNPRNSDEKLRGLEIQAQEQFPATSFAKAGDRFIL